MADRPKNMIRGELGVAGFTVWNGQISEEFIPELAGARGRRVYREMSLNDPVVGAILFIIEMAFRELKPTVVPASDSAEDIRAAEFLRSNMDDMSHSWPSFMSDIVTMFTYGWAYFETVYKFRRGLDGDPSSENNDGLIGWRKFALRSQLTLNKWVIDEEGGLQGMEQIPPPPKPHIPVTIPIWKSVLLKTKHAGGNPEGQSILRTSYTSWYYRKNLQAMEAISLERMGVGIPTIELPEGYTDDDLALAKEVIRAYRIDEQMGFVLPPGVKLTLAFGGRGAVGNAFESAIVRYRQEILMSVLTQFVGLGMGTSIGSYALGKTQKDIFQLALVGWLREIENTLNLFSVRALFKYNRTAFPTITKTPKIGLGTIGDTNLEQLIVMLKDLVPIGAVQLDEGIRARIRELFELPEVDPKNPPEELPVEETPCPECGAMVKNGQETCPSCGADLSEDEDENEEDAKE